MYLFHTAEVVTRVFRSAEKGERERMGGGDARIKIDQKGQTSIVRLVLSGVPFKSGVWSL